MTTTKPNLAKKVRTYVSAPIIRDSECRDPNKCMIKVAMAGALRIPHGYIHVDSTGISITRRKDYREKAFLPKPAQRNMILFDDDSTRHLVKPFYFTAEFHKTTKVYVSNPKRKARINELRRGKRMKKYDLHSRIVGLSVPTPKKKKTKSAD